MSEEAVTENAVPGSRRRERSTIAFPYGDLEAGIAIARALLDHGGGRGDLNSLAAWAGHDSSKSGTFRNKVYASRDFGLVEIDKTEISLSALGYDILDSEKEAAARANAFLAVPLYRAIYEDHEGKLLPKDAGLENRMHSLGVAQKQVAKARQVFARSAGQAGFLAFGYDRLVKPAEPQGAKRDEKPEAHRVETTASSPSAPTTDRSVKTINLGSGGEVTLSLSVDLVALSKHDRDFVFKLIDSLNGYTAGAPTEQELQAGSAPSGSPRTAKQGAV